MVRSPSSVAIFLVAPKGSGPCLKCIGGTALVSGGASGRSARFRVVSDLPDGGFPRVRRRRRVARSLARLAASFDRIILESGNRHIDGHHFDADEPINRSS